MFIWKKLTASSKKRGVDYNTETGYYETKITYGRRLARYLSKFQWYYPKSGDSGDGPSLEKAWASFEHVTLYRYVSKDDRNETLTNRGDSHQLAQAGDRDVKTHLYPLWTPENQLSDFGIGIGLYFTTLRMLSIILFIAFLINIPSILAYENESGEDDPLLFGSAVCTLKEWKPCNDCGAIEFGKFPSTYRKLGHKIGDTNLKFILQNMCGVTAVQGFSMYASALFVLLSVLMLMYYLKKREVYYDEIQQTTSDYSLLVMNPPTDARDPQEWKDFFDQFDEDGHITVITISLKNKELLNTILRRRELLLKFENLLPPGIDMDVTKLDELVEQIPSVEGWRKMFWNPKKTASGINDKIKEIRFDLKKMSQKKYDVADIFVIFENERSQRKALEKLSVSDFNVLTQNKDALESEDYLFRGKHVLEVREPAEPEMIRWQDLDTPALKGWIQRIVTTLLSFIFIFCGAVVMRYVQEFYYDVFIIPAVINAPTFVILFLNSITPTIVTSITNLFEAHRNSNSLEVSLFLKLCLMRWTNTAVLFTLVMPFSEKLDQDGVLTSVVGLLYAEMVYTPLIKVMDLGGNFKRHFMGPRAPDQRRMNLNFEGTIYNLAERYTATSKILFLVLYYSMLLPMGYLYGAIALFVHYVTDKYCLLRIWYRAPPMGSTLSKLTSNFIFPLVLTIYFSIAPNYWASFPYDNACKVDKSVNESYYGNYEVVLQDNFTTLATAEDVTVTEGDSLYEYCDQEVDIVSMEELNVVKYFESFEKITSKWMSEDQKLVAKFLTPTSILIAAFLYFFFLVVLVKGILDFFRKKYVEPHREEHSIRFSDVPTIPAYIPKIDSPLFDNILFACKVDGLNEELVGSEPPPEGYDVLINDVIDSSKAVESDLKPAESGDEANSKNLESENEDQTMFEKILDFAKKSDDEASSKSLEGKNEEQTMLEKEIDFVEKSDEDAGTINSDNEENIFKTSSFERKANYVNREITFGDIDHNLLFGTVKWWPV